MRVIEEWSEFQFTERRMPTLEEINAVTPETPVFILHLYCRALLNKAALRACGYTKDTPNPPGGEIQHDSKGNPTGLLIARPNAAILYATLAKGPKLPPEHQMNSTRHFMRELNRLGLTSVIDAAKTIINSNRPGDESFLERFISSDKIETVQDFTSNKDALFNGLDTLYIEGGQTAVIDGVYLAAEHVAQYKKGSDDDRRRRALIVVTDGEDRASSAAKCQQMAAH